jgi:uncharacterized membrane protein
VSTDRLEAFSDGVFAIAITLLALELPRPDGPDLWHELGAAWESYAAYFVSFLTIGIIWVNHHALVDRIARADRTLLFLNLGLLMWVSLIPWPTGLLADRLGEDGASAAAVVYSGVLLAMAITFRAVWAHARSTGSLAALTPAQVAHLDRRNSVGLLTYAVAVASAFVVPAVSIVLCFAVAAFFMLPDRAERLESYDAA